MLGLLINVAEQREMEYLIKRELEENLFDLEDERIEHIVKPAMKERYQLLFRLLQRVASPEDCMKYMLRKQTK
ncbi:hypothetical protein [Paracerasibacillus soli]|uniref:CARD domain-containing protein n=1 Tax=Paracerasibacillus soli TaxID=480284 RepID=A0ABU5CXJ1_9BACI|nr:hypothetical protein [Virgibacillus soli]MDY0410123.1 hypothetical protein [Virgibacillus soli]